MSLPVVLRPAADQEFEDAAQWYESQRAGLGGDFAAEVRQVFDTISNYPERFPLADGDIREAPVARFPYCVYYRVRSTHVVVIAVFHTSRDPSIWQGRS
jgi:plasmid stabilization system protein ParE